MPWANVPNAAASAAGVLNIDTGSIGFAEIDPQIHQVAKQTQLANSVSIVCHEIQEYAVPATLKPQARGIVVVGTRIQWRYSISRRACRHPTGPGVRRNSRILKPPMTPTGRLTKKRTCQCPASLKANPSNGPNASPSQKDSDRSLLYTAVG